jgi:hypothetical protein
MGNTFAFYFVIIKSKKFCLLKGGVTHAQVLSLKANPHEISLDAYV